MNDTLISTIWIISLVIVVMLGIGEVNIIYALVLAFIPFSLYGQLEKAKNTEDNESTLVHLSQWVIVYALVYGFGKLLSMLFK